MPLQELSRLPWAVFHSTLSSALCDSLRPGDVLASYSTGTLGSGSNPDGASQAALCGEQGQSPARFFPVNFSGFWMVSSPAPPPAPPSPPLLGSKLSFPLRLSFNRAQSWPPVTLACLPQSLTLSHGPGPPTGHGSRRFRKLDGKVTSHLYLFFRPRRYLCVWLCVRG
jgi:hypothetical protein